MASGRCERPAPLRDSAACWAHVRLALPERLTSYWVHTPGQSHLKSAIGMRYGNPKFSGEIRCIEKAASAVPQKEQYTLGFSLCGKIFSAVNHPSAANKKQECRFNKKEVVAGFCRLPSSKKRSMDGTQFSFTASRKHRWGTQAGLPGVHSRHG
jgi:hypothetical protein